MSLIEPTALTVWAYEGNEVAFYAFRDAPDRVWTLENGMTMEPHMLDWVLDNIYKGYMTAYSYGKWDKYHIL